MTIVAIADALGGGWLRRLFHREPMIEAAELLLQERTPRDIAVARPLVAEGGNPTRVQDDAPSDGRRLDTPHSATPATHLLSNGHYSVMLTAAGSGYSRWDGLSITRWREDPTCDDWGAFFYLRDCDSGAVWSAGFQPSGVEPDEYSVLFKEDRGEIVRCDGTLVTSLDVLVSAEDAGEVRRLCLHNLGRTARSIEITAYAELVLTTAATDQAHPAFAKMFVETEYLADQGILLATRRSGAGQDVALWVAQFAVVDGPAIAPLQIETDRARFLGRGGTPRRAAAMLQDGPLSGSAGVVLDPIFALRHRVRVDAGGVVHITVWTMAAASRQAVLDLVDRHRDAAAFDRAGTLAWTQAQVQLHHVGIDSGEAGLFQRIASHLLYAAPSLRPSSDVIRRGAGRRQGLWGQGISGDLPILVLRIADVESLDFVRQILQAHEYWRMKQLAVDVVLLNERASSYAQDLQGALETLLRISQSRTAPGTGRTSDGNGKVVILRTDLLAPDTHALLLSTARVVFLAHLGRLADQLDRLPEGRVLPRPPAPARRPASSLRHEPTTPAPPPPGTRAVERSGRLRRGGTVLCHAARARTMDPGAVDQYRRQ